MATVAIANNLGAVQATPFLIRQYSLTGGTTELDITHGEDRAPDMVLFNDKTATANTAGIWTSRQKSATVTTVDCSVDAATTLADCWMIWFDQASGGIS